MALAPICLFVYARPEHTRRSLAALAAADLAADSILLVYADGPRGDEPPGRIAEVRQLIRAARGFGSVEIFEREKNAGLAESIIAGVTDACRRFGKAIVVEDDVVVSRYFLRYMNDGLTLYADEEQVCGIGGYMYPVSEPLPDQFFLGITDTWGWATWKRCWDAFEPDAAKLLAEIRRRGLASRFNMDNSYDYLRMLKDCAEARNSSWGIRWYAVNMLAGRLTLYPGKSMTANIGLDGTGYHGGNTRSFDVAVANEPLALRRLPLREDAVARQAVGRFLREHTPTLGMRVLSRLKKWTELM
jgi:hypothetical protein